MKIHPLTQSRHTISDDTRLTKLLRRHYIGIYSSSMSWAELLTSTESFKPWRRGASGRLCPQPKHHPRAPRYRKILRGFHSESSSHCTDALSRSPALDANFLSFPLPSRSNLGATSVTCRVWRNLYTDRTVLRVPISSDQRAGGRVSHSISLLSTITTPFHSSLHHLRSLRFDVGSFLPPLVVWRHQSYSRCPQ